MKQRQKADMTICCSSDPPPVPEAAGDRILDDITLARLCKAMGHPARVAIVEYLKHIDTCICGEIVNILPLAQSTVSQHLKQLKEAGLVKGTVEGPRTCYCLDKHLFNRFKKAINAL